MAWHNYYDDRPFHALPGDGYVVRLYVLGFVRYVEGSRIISFAGELADETEKFGRRWLILPTVTRVLYLPSTLKWDSGEPIDLATEKLIIDRIDRAFKARKGRYRIEVDDSVYETLEDPSHGDPLRVTFFQ